MQPDGAAALVPQPIKRCLGDGARAAPTPIFLIHEHPGDISDAALCADLARIAIKEEPSGACHHASAVEGKKPAQLVGLMAFPKIGNRSRFPVVAEIFVRHPQFTPHRHPKVSGSIKLRWFCDAHHYRFCFQRSLQGTSTRG